MKETFKPAWWLPGPNLQTLWPYFFRKRVKSHTHRERFELSDGDFVDLDWTARHSRKPIVIVLHGLEGSARSAYAGGILAAIMAQGWQGVVMHFRSCSGELNRHARMYHSGDTGDLAEVVAAIRKREPGVPLAAVGYSVGGNVLLKWLGETGRSNPLLAAVAVSVPFSLGPACDQLNKGFSRLYQRHFLRELREKVHKKYPHPASSWQIPDFSQIHSMRDFDDLVTAPLHGFRNAEDYYQQASCRPWLKRIAVKTLLLQAKDDPFMPPDITPPPDELSSSITLELTEKGGHIGFVGGRWPWHAEYWPEKRVPEFIAPYFDHWLSKQRDRMVGDTGIEPVAPAV